MARFLSLWAILLLVPVSLSAGESAKPALSQTDRVAVEVLFAYLRDAFLAGNHRLIPALLTARDNAEAERSSQIADAIRRDFKTRSYVEFQVRELSVEEAIDARRLDLWVSLRMVCENADKVRVENFHNNLFLVERQADGSFLFVDSPFFQTLGRQQGVGLIADALLAAIGCLMGLTFWVWMGFAAFSLRPRRPAWRTAVTLIPLLGALVFFLVCYLPGLFRRSAEPDEVKSRSGLTNHV